MDQGQAAMDKGLPDQEDMEATEEVEATGEATVEVMVEQEGPSHLPRLQGVRGQDCPGPEKPMQWECRVV